MEFSWDEAKDSANLLKHGLGFAEAATLFTSGVDFLEIFDDTYLGGEERFIAIAPVARGVIVVVYTEEVEDKIRIISARPADQDEVRAYQRAMDAE
ncbi:MAG TPA: BrnT family toxin [Pseudodesulfovibrio sp.]|nr:BrnT family toxin [Pseudodesulfovibrio sp.]